MKLNYFFVSFVFLFISKNISFANLLVETLPTNPDQSQYIPNINLLKRPFCTYNIGALPPKTPFDPPRENIYGDYYSSISTLDRITFSVHCPRVGYQIGGEYLPAVIDSCDDPKPREIQFSCEFGIIEPMEPFFNTVSIDMFEYIWTVDGVTRNLTSPFDIFPTPFYTWNCHSTNTNGTQCKTDYITQSISSAINSTF